MNEIFYASFFMCEWSIMRSMAVQYSELSHLRGMNNPDQDAGMMWVISQNDLAVDC